MHRVIVVQFEDPHAPTFYVYDIHAEGLTPFKIELSHELEDISRLPFPHAVIGPWQSKLLGSSPSFDSRAAEQLFTMKQNSAVLRQVAGHKTECMKRLPGHRETGKDLGTKDDARLLIHHSRLSLATVPLSTVISSLPQGLRFA